MSTSKRTAEFIEDQLATLDVHTKPMFGEYGVYCDGKVVGFITDDVLFIKPSPADPSLFERCEPGHAYPGSKIYHGVPGDALDDHEWLCEAIQATADALPAPKPKKPRASGGGAGR